jgi:hypothetical protein
MKYYGDIYSVALNEALESQDDFAQLLMSKQAPEWKSRIVRLAFGVMQLQRTEHPERLDYGYFVACSLQSYLGEHFAPNQLEPGFKMTDGFFIETVENALRWWETNQSAYQQ